MDDEIAQLARTCLQARVTADPQHADYRLRLDRYSDAYPHLQTRYRFRPLLCKRDGTLVSAGDTGPSLDVSLDATCKAIVSDWPDRSH